MDVICTAQKYQSDTNFHSQPHSDLNTDLKGSFQKGLHESKNKTLTITPTSCKIHKPPCVKPQCYCSSFNIS